MRCIICCCPDYEDRKKPDKRKARRERRQSARGMLGHMERFNGLGKKAIRKVKAIEKSMEMGEKKMSECSSGQKLGRGIEHGDS